VGTKITIQAWNPRLSMSISKAVQPAVATTWLPCLGRGRSSLDSRAGVDPGLANPWAGSLADRVYVYHPDVTARLRSVGDDDARLD